MKRISRAPLALIVALVAAASACMTTTTTNAPTNTASTNANAAPTNANANVSASPSPTVSPTPASEASLPVTLPVLDAMFADSSFAGALKAKLQLTDEQVARLRQIAREETAKLSESKAQTGTTSEATRSAAEKIKGIVGEEKLAAFTAFVGERWSGGGGALPGKPNSVPTDTRIVVNAPAFRMDVFENGQLTKTYRIGIGYPEFPLPQGMRNDTIVVEDGRLRIYRDVYDKGTNTEENLRRVLDVYGVRLEDLSEQERAQASSALQEMAHDAHGNPSRDSSAPPRGKSQSGNVTYNVKGQKEVVIEVAALRGKGYPAPVNLTPPAPQPTPQKAAPRKRGR